MQDPLPLLIGGKGDRMLGIVARYADEWNMWGLADTIAERAAVLDARCEAIGRDPGEIKRSAQALFLRHRRRRQGRGLPRGRRPPRRRRHAPTTIAEAVADVAGVGLDEVIVPDFTLGKGQNRLDRLDPSSSRSPRSSADPAGLRGLGRSGLQPRTAGRHGRGRRRARTAAGRRGRG